MIKRENALQSFFLINRIRCNRVMGFLFLLMFSLAGVINALPANCCSGESGLIQVEESCCCPSGAISLTKYQGPTNNPCWNATECPEICCSAVTELIVIPNVITNVDFQPIILCTRIDSVISEVEGNSFHQRLHPLDLPVSRTPLHLKLGVLIC